MADSMIQVFQETVARRSERPAARFKGKDGQWVGKTWREMSEDRKVIAAGLLALGLKEHERVNIIANTSYRWVLADLAVQSCAGEPVAIYQSNLPDECQYQKYRIEIDTVRDAIKSDRTDPEKGRILREVHAKIIGYVEH